jgi:hypothetical protein
VPDRPAADGLLGRGLDQRLQDVVAAIRSEQGRMVVLVDVSAATMHACRTALNRLPAGWQRVRSPRTAQELVAGLLADRPAGAGAAGRHPNTVIWLDDLERYLAPGDPVLAERVADVVRGALHHRAAGRLLIVGTLRAHPQRWHLIQAPASGGRDRWAQTRALLREATIVPLGSSVPAAPDEPPPVVVPAATPVQTVSNQPPVLVDAEEPPASVVATSSRAEAVRVVQVAPPKVPVAPPIVPVVSVMPVVVLEAGDPPARRAPSEASIVEARVVEAQVVEAPAEVTSATPCVDAGHVERDTPPQDAVQVRVHGFELLDALDRLQHSQSWAPTPLPPVAVVPEPTDLVYERARSKERAGYLPGAERLYERAAIGGDLEALSRLGRLRAQLGSPQIAAQLELYRQAKDARNTGVLFSLAAAGHAEALKLLRRLQAEAEAAQPKTVTPAEIGQQARRQLRQRVAAKGSRRRKRRRSR